MDSLEDDVFFPENVSTDGEDTLENVTAMECDPSQDTKEWSELPSLPIEKIYSFLSRNDQCRMSLVCRRWCREYSSPSLWKTIKFYLPERVYPAEIHPEVKFARRYGSMFRNVDIIGNRIRTSMLDDIWTQLKLFLEILSTNSRLSSIRFVNMAKYFRHLDAVFYASAYQLIAQLLDSQSCLRTVEFHDARFSFEEGVEILRTIAEKNSGALQNLTLRRFVDVDLIDPNPNPEAVTTLCSLMRDEFWTLRKLVTDYTQVFENMFPRVFDSECSARKHVLSNIVLHCAGSKRSRFRGLPPTAWNHLQRRCPDLKVDMYFDPGAHPLEEIEFFVTRGMPLKFLDFRLDRPYNATSEVDFGLLFGHLLACKCHEHLESLYLVWMQPIPNLASELVPFLKACSKLRSFQLFTLYPIGGVDEMLKALLEDRPKALEDVLLSISHIRNEEDYAALIVLADDCCPLLQVCGLNAHVVLDPGW